MDSTCALVFIIALAIIAALLYKMRSLNEQLMNQRSQQVTPPKVKVSQTPQDFPATTMNIEEITPDGTHVHIRAPGESVTTRPRERKGSAPANLDGALLIGLTGACKGATYPLSVTGLTVGRYQECDVVIDDARVSGRHAWMGIVDSKPVIRDLKSTNGTFLNAQINSCVEETELRSGDTILFGGHQGNQFRFLVG